VQDHGLIDPAAVARFRAAVPAFEGSIGVAVSGGPDSLALLLLAAAAWPGRVVAATVDHRLRPEAADEARHVAEICRTRGVPHEILTPSAPITGSLQAAARAARYALLEEWRDRHGASWIMTAHHADDQAETLLMRLNRGAGLRGLAGVRRINGQILRPLLGWRRDELGAIVAASGVVPVADPSNADPRFDRVRIRQGLAAAPWIDAAALAQSAAHLAEAEDALTWTAARLAEDRVSADATALVLDPAGIPPALLRRMVEAILHPDAPSGPALDRLIAALRAGEQASMGDTLCRGGPRWRFTPAPPRRK
jgi:tRNA(Ile)-lysidine synthase